MPPTPVLHAELQVAGVRVLCDQTRLEFRQLVDYAGRPSGDVRLVSFEVILSGPAAFLPLWPQLSLNNFRRESGVLVWRTGQGQTVRRLTFFDAPCVALAFALDSTGAGQAAASGLQLCFSPAAVDLQGVFVELHSRLAWEPDAAVRRRALVQPFVLPALRPPAAPPRPLPPELPLAPVMGGALALAGLLLLPANDADAPGYDVDKSFGRLNSPLLTAAQRLAYLEQERAHRPLNPHEQAQYEALLVKVKGLHGGEPPLTVSPDYEGEVPMEHSDLGRMALAHRKAKQKDNWHDGNVTVFEYKDKDGELRYQIEETNPLITKRHAERIALEKLQKQGVTSQNITRIYSELEPCETPDGGKKGDGCKAMINEEAPNAKITYSYQYRGSGVSTRNERMSSMNRRAEYFKKFQK